MGVLEEGRERGRKNTRRNIGPNLIFSLHMQKLNKLRDSPPRHIIIKLLKAKDRES